MSVNKYNAEGYHDPTVYEALTNIEKGAKKSDCKPLVFICSPYAGDVEYNIQMARAFSKFAVGENCIPIAPHLLFPQFIDDNDAEMRILGLFMGMVLMVKCSEVWVFGSKISKGMSIEIEKAKQKSIPIRYFTNDCGEVRK